MTHKKINDLRKQQEYFYADYNCKYNLIVQSCKTTNCDRNWSKKSSENNVCVNKFPY